MRGKFLAALTIIGILALLPLAGCKQNTAQDAVSGENKAGSKGAGAAAETSLAIPTLDGSSASLDQYKGKIVLVNFWATWCDPCKTEIPWLIDLNHKYGPKGLVILGVAMDDEGKKVVAPWVQAKRFDVHGQQEAMDYPILLGNDKIADKFGGILGLPTSMLYSRDGRKLKTIVGLLNLEDLTKTLDSQL
jgi:cytochrome c biogenesis protein CcmG/thiol:disulfide interchange protein DsbE